MQPGEGSDKPDARPVLILGPGRMAVHIIRHFENHTAHRVAGFVHDQPDSAVPESIEDLPVFDVKEIAGMARTHLALCYLGEPSRRTLVQKVEALGFEFTTIVDPGAQLEPSVSIGKGTIIGSLTIVDHHTHVGCHCLIGSHGVIGHDCVLEDYVTILPGTVVGGGTSFGTASFVGMGARIRDGIMIGESAVIGIGSVVVKDVPAGLTVVGNPARALERHGPVF